MTDRKSLAEQLAPMRAAFRRDAPVIKTVVQITAEIAGEDNTLAANEARRHILAWMQKRAGRLPDQAWKGESFELDTPGSPAAVVALKDPADYWAARLFDPDKDVAGRMWATEATVAVADDRALFGLRLTVSVRRDDPPFEPSIPLLVRQICESPGLISDGVTIRNEPWTLGTEEDVLRLVELIEDPIRKRPVFVVSLPEGQRNPATAAIDAENVSRRCVGLAHVVVLSSPLSFALTKVLDKEYSVFNGAVRTYLPGFLHYEDRPQMHPWALPGTIAAWNGIGSSEFERFLIERAFQESVGGQDAERQMPSFGVVRKLELEQRRDIAVSAGADNLEQLELAQLQIEEFQEEVNAWQSLAQGEEHRRRDVESEVKELKGEAFSFRARIAHLETALEEISGQSIDEKIEIPTSLDELQAWNDKSLAGRVTILGRASKSAKGALFQDVTLAYKAVLMLAQQYREMKLEGGAEKQRVFHEACESLGLRCEPSFSSTRAGEEGDAYFVNWKGRRRSLDMHLKNGGNTRDPTRCLRVYFFWDDETSQVVIGQLPTHLPTRLT